MNDTVEIEYRDKLGEEFGAIFHRLRIHWAFSVMRSKEFEALFSDAATVELLSAIGGGGFIRDIQNILWDDLILRITRLTDPIQTARKDNLTVRKLPEFCENGLRSEVEDLVKSAGQRTAFARDWRNQHISHTDLTRAIDPDVEPLAPASLQQINAALNAIHAVLDRISSCLLNENIRNDIAYRPRASAFVAYSRQLVEAVKYIDSLIDSSGTAHITDVDVAGDFLRRLGCEPTADQVRQIIELRDAGRRFKAVPSQGRRSNRRGTLYSRHRHTG